MGDCVLRWKWRSWCRPLLYYLFCIKNFYWNIFDLQCCVSFRCTAKWFSFIYIYIYICIYTHTHITHISSHTSHLHPFIFWWSLSLLPWLSTVNSAAVKVAVHVSFRIMVLPDISPGVELQNQMLQYSEKKGSLQVWALLS